MKSGPYEQPRGTGKGVARRVRLRGRTSCFLRKTCIHRLLHPLRQCSHARSRIYRTPAALGRGTTRARAEALARACVLLFLKYFGQVRGAAMRERD